MKALDHRVDRIDVSVDLHLIFEEVPHSGQPLLAVEDDLLTVAVDNDVDGRDVPLAEDGVDKSLASWVIPDLASLEIRLKVQLTGPDAADDSFQLEVGFFEFQNELLSQGQT